ncbi:hypothetical protein NOI24_03550 [Neorhizobium galegae]|uniref:hypothetical protein n=1 Tax=Neorhizobium galegae TaxID=399 RepID=UPI0021058AC1|nr:hypothetical protein [Neorhizobium galegae]MCQ1770360.1 hypothetical protein [Neorhizobium galegae]MCQ1799681.1 hypothetical protein [Neorhizobium galegae]
MHEGIRHIIDLDTRRTGVVLALWRTMMRDDPVLAQAWRDMNEADLRVIFPHRPPQPFPVDLVGSAVEVLLGHPRYGYVAEWLDRWREDSMSLKEDICRDHGYMPRELDALLNAELERRRLLVL